MAPGRGPQYPDGPPGDRALALRPVLLVDAVGLTPRHVGEATPALRALAEAGVAAPLEGVLPAVTLPAQATMLTGVPPSRHGVVGNVHVQFLPVFSALHQTPTLGRADALNTSPRQFTLIRHIEQSVLETG